MTETIADGTSDSIVEIEREYGLSHGDFRRIFPRVEPDAEQIAERNFRLLHVDGRGLDIELSPEHVRQLASLKISFIEIRFRFAGWDARQRAEFFEKFDRSFQKGGG